MQVKKKFFLSGEDVAALPKSLARRAMMVPGCFGSVRFLTCFDLWQLRVGDGEMKGGVDQNCKAVLKCVTDSFHSALARCHRLLIKHEINCLIFE